MWKQVRICLSLFIALSILTGLIYPVLITGMSQILFSKEANGSLLLRNGIVSGSKLIGQEFQSPKYFWGRLSATSPPYNTSASSGSNYGPLNSKLIEATKSRLQQLHAADPENREPVPVDLVTASASGLDPQISIASALYQEKRIARLRKLPEEKVHELIEQYTSGRFLGLLGEPVVNVLQLNLALDEIAP